MHLPLPHKRFAFSPIGTKGMHRVGIGAEGGGGVFAVYAREGAGGCGEGGGDAVAEVRAFFGGVGLAGGGIFAGGAIGADGYCGGEPV